MDKKKALVFGISAVICIFMVIYFFIEVRKIFPGDEPSPPTTNVRTDNTPVDVSPTTPPPSNNQQRGTFDDNSLFDDIPAIEAPVNLFPVVPPPPIATSVAPLDTEPLIAALSAAMYMGMARLDTSLLAMSEMQRNQNMAIGLVAGSIDNNAAAIRGLDSKIDSMIHTLPGVLQRRTGSPREDARVAAADRYVFTTNSPIVREPPIQAPRANAPLVWGKALFGTTTSGLLLGNEGSALVSITIDGGGRVICRARADMSSLRIKLEPYMYVDQFGNTYNVAGDVAGPDGMTGVASFIKDNQGRIAAWKIFTEALRTSGAAVRERARTANQTVTTSGALGQNTVTSDRGQDWNRTAVGGAISGAGDAIGSTFGAEDRLIRIGANPHLRVIFTPVPPHIAGEQGNFADPTRIYPDDRFQTISGRGEGVGRTPQAGAQPPVAGTPDYGVLPTGSAFVPATSQPPPPAPIIPPHGSGSDMIISAPGAYDGSPQGTGAVFVPSSGFYR